MFCSPIFHHSFFSFEIFKCLTFFSALFSFSNFPVPFSFKSVKFSSTFFFFFKLCSTFFLNLKCLKVPSTFYFSHFVALALPWATEYDAVWTVPRTGEQIPKLVLKPSSCFKLLSSWNFFVNLWKPVLWNLWIPVLPAQLPRLVRAVKSQVGHRSGVLTLQVPT